MKVLVTGGAGFIGSTVSSALIDAGHTPVILDNLVTGREAFTAGRIFYRGDIADGALLDQIFAEHPDITATVNCAALIVVPESVAQPLRYYRENVAKTIDFLGHLARNGCRRMVFSSTAALYGASDDFSVDEDSVLEPSSPYARTKVMMEQILADCVATGELDVISLRYFNPIGADPKMRTGLQLRYPSHALGKMIQCWENGDTFQITGVDWPTRDGSGIRDYIHVWDLAAAHVAALEKFDEVMAATPDRYRVMNLGSGEGTTVRELLDAFAAVTGEKLPAVETDPRPGDVVGAFARSRHARALLGWTPRFSVEDGVRHALQWRALDNTTHTS
ncbi:UDP-glucose 4-epimerase GalE [Catellatospora tritici]|uniref:UDP-glucose 4-epimerase GalE n=1 Tax=Catellatospora tritici TaxID=2851566 RepID=UPI001C2DE96F|nr:UDP-glucose 4-epimerase GalE [Catellatospora tritici]MBV1849259.1 UDP-glucose 4-epimerase GalE [Catellatospora tritici]